MEVDREVAQKPDKMFTLKKWNLVAMWSWDVECDTCAICRVQVMGKLMKDTRPGFLFRLRDCATVLLIKNNLLRLNIIPHSLLYL